MEGSSDGAPRRARPDLGAWLAGAGVATTLLLLLALIPFACPTGDDYYRAWKGRDGGWYHHIAVEMYEQWSGRWSGVGLAAAILPRVDMMRCYPLLVGLLLPAHVLSISAFWRVLLGDEAGRRARRALTAGTVAVLWAGLPAPGETHYWFSGGLEYHLSISLGLLLIAGLARSRWEALGPPRAIGRAVGLSALGFFVAGMQELVSLMLCAALGATTAVVLASRPPRRRALAWVVVSAATCAGLAFMAAAPGNAVRSAATPTAGDLALTLQLARQQAWQRIPPWLLDLRLLSATALALLSPPIARARPAWVRHFGPARRRLAFGLWALLLAALFIVPSWALGYPMPGRTANAGYTFFVLGWILLVFAATRPAGDDATGRATPGEPAGLRAVRTGAAAVLGLSLVFTGNSWTTIGGLASGAIRDWNSTVRWRDRMLAEAARAGASEVAVPVADYAAEDWKWSPWPFYSDEITADPADWRNVGVANYYGVDAVRRAPAGAPGLIRLSRGGGGDGGRPAE